MSSNTTKNRGVMYKRVSSAEQKEKGYSLQSQDRELRQKMLKDGVEEVHAPIEDVESGTNFERKGLKELKRLASEGLIDYVYVYSLDRLGRHVAEVPYFMYKLKQKGAIVRDIKEEHKLDQPADYLIVTSKCLPGHSESIAIGERTQRGKNEKFMQGKWVGPEPFGCRVNPDGFLEKIPELEPIVHDFFQIYANTGDFKSAAQKINQKYSGKITRITTNKLGTILNNPVYVGKKRYGKIQIDAPHLAFISADLWDRVRLLIETRAKKRKPKQKRKPHSILDDFASEYGLDYVMCVLKELKPVCPKCASLMEGNGSKTVLGLRVPNFICTNKNCKHQRTIPSGHELERFLRQSVGCPLCRAVEDFDKTVAFDGSIVYICRRCFTSFQFTPTKEIGKTNENLLKRKIEDYRKYEQPNIAKLATDPSKQPKDLDKIRLQKALEMAMSAGYQFSKDAFDFLGEIAVTRDPTKIIHEVIRRLEELRTKPFFIERSHLEPVIELARES